MLHGNMFGVALGVDADFCIANMLIGLYGWNGSSQVVSNEDMRSSVGG